MSLKEYGKTSLAILGAVVILLCIATPLLKPVAKPMISGKSPIPVTVSGSYPVDVVSVHDGDTIRVNVRLPWKVGLYNETLRMADYDAWELTKTRQSVDVSDSELVKGKAAKVALQELLEIASVVLLTPVDTSRDVYGRLLGSVTVIDQSGNSLEVADWMRGRGHCRKITGNP